MKHALNRRQFLQSSGIAGLGWAVLGTSVAPGKNLFANNKRFATGDVAPGKRIGIIGLDTSHSTAFTKALNDTNADAAYDGYKIVAAFPQGSTTIKSSYERIPAYTEEVKKAGVEIVDSIAALLTKVDVVLLETNDGRPHPAQAIEVIKTGKTLFIDKPVAGSLADVIAIYDAAKHYNTPLFSASSLRYATNVQDTATGKAAGKIVGADSYSPCPLESTHPDFFWYGIHGVEILLTVMGMGCKEVSRVHTTDTDTAIGVWTDGRVGTFRGNRKGPNEYGGIAFGEKALARLGPYNGYEPLLKEIIKFFNTGVSPVSAAETLEIYAFMEAADESKRRKGQPVSLEDVMKKAIAQKKKLY